MHTNHIIQQLQSSAIDIVAIEYYDHICLFSSFCQSHEWLHRQVEQAILIAQIQLGGCSGFDHPIGIPHLLYFYRSLIYLFFFIAISIGLDWQADSWHRYTGFEVGSYFKKHIHQQKLERSRKHPKQRKRLNKGPTARDEDYGVHAIQPALVGQELESECNRILASLQVIFYLGHASYQ